MQPMSRMLQLALPVSLLFSSFCFAQTASIQGDAKGEDGKPLVGATIKIERTDIKQNFSVKTDKKGHYFYGGLGFPGTFNVTIEVNGKVADSIQGVKPSPTAEINFDLKAAAEKTAKANTPAEIERGMTPQQKADYEKKKKDSRSRARQEQGAQRCV